MTHVEGGIGSSQYKADRIHIKIGQAEEGEPDVVKLVSNMMQAKSLFGKGELIDSLQQHFEEYDEDLNQTPVPVLCVRPVNDIPGNVSLPSLAGTGKATAVCDGVPSGDSVVKLKISKAGKSGVAEYRKSIDGGTFGMPVVTPASSSAISLGFGVSVKFTDDTVPDDTFALNDVWTFNITGPKASIESKLNTMAKLKTEYGFYWMHLIGEVDRDVAVSVLQILQDMESNYHFPTFAILESKQSETEITTIDQFSDYAQDLIDHWEPFKSTRICVCAGEGRYIPKGIATNGGYEMVKENPELGRWKNCATLLCAKLSIGSPNVSAAWVEKMRSLTMSEIRYWNLGYRDWMDILHDNHLTVMKVYDDYDGVYIAKDKILAESDSDFLYIPERRRADKMQRLVYKHSLQFLNSDTYSGSGTGGLDYLKTYIDSKISEEMEMQGQAEISGHEIILDPNKTFSKTRILQAILKMYVSQRVEAIEWMTSFSIQK
jgi:hypothetical protein